MADEPRALREGLREQTIIIEDTTAELKRLLNKAVFGGMLEVEFIKKADKLILDSTDEMKDDTLKANARAILRRFARTQFKKLRAILIGNRVGFSFAALALVKRIYNAESAKDKETAYRALQRIEPQFADVQITFEPGRAGTWRWATPLRMYSEDYMNAVDRAAEMLAKDSPKDIDGLPLRLKAEMYVRYQWQQENMRELRESGVKLVWISSHENCSKRCQPYQGRLYSMDGTSGVRGNTRYVPIEEATDRYYTTKAGVTYKNGTLSGFNCRHYTIPYTEDGERPPKLTDERIEKARAIEQEQRRLERRVYHLREKYYAFKDQNEKRALNYYRQAAQAKRDYVRFCRENEVAWYPSRIRVNP